MCGISGIFKLPGSDLKNDDLREKLISMNKSIKHRGPNDSGVFVHNNFGLASVRLSIQDLSQDGHMPMEDSNNGNTIVHNGEVYNFKEIAKNFKLNVKSDGTGFKIFNLRGFNQL